MRKLLSNKLFIILIGSVLGLLLPLSFVLIDLYELQLKVNWENFFEIVNSQNLYPFSFILFPSSCVLICFLFSSLYFQRIKINKERETLKTVFNTVGDIIIVLDQNMDILFSNKKYDQFLNADLNNQKDNIDVFTKTLLALSKHLGQKEFKLTLSQNKSLYLFANISPIDFKESKGFIVSLRNTTEINENKEIIIDQEREIQHSSRLSSLGEMAGGIAHEINNPLAIIKGWTSKIDKMIKYESIDLEKLAKGVVNINKTVDRINIITKTLLRLSNSKRKNKKQALNPKDIFESCLSLAHGKIRDSNVKMIVKNNSIPDELFLLNQVEIEQILLNLIGNGADELKSIEQDKKEITLSFDSDKHNLYFKVSDNGPGIPEDIVEKNFQPMFTTKPVGQGTGLGLSLCFSMAKDLEGELTLNQSSGLTTFVLKIPYHKEQTNQLEKKNVA